MQAPEAWNSIRGAVQDACESYNAHYSSDVNTTVKCKLENGHRIVVSRFMPANRVTTFQDRNPQIVIEYDSQSTTVTVAYDQPAGSQTFRISADDQGVFIVDSKSRITADRLSEKVLKDLFFSPPDPADDSED